MTQIKHILVPTDGSESALRAAEFAGLEARKHDADVTILIVHDEAPLALPAMAAAILPGSTSYTPFPREEAIKHIEEAAEKGELQETTQRLGDVPGTVTRVQLWGDAAKIICEYAAANDVGHSVAVLVNVDLPGPIAGSGALLADREVIDVPVARRVVVVHPLLVVAVEDVHRLKRDLLQAFPHVLHDLENIGSGLYE